MTLQTLIEPGWADYALIDSGAGRKLERYGTYLIDRPEPQAFWRTSKPQAEWAKAHASFTNASDREDDEGGQWTHHTKLPNTWPVRVLDTTILCRLTAYRHMGLFPEQRPHWQWIAGQIKAAQKPLKILNLFAYTGAASLIAAAAGAHVTHLDASKKAIQWAKENQDASRLLDKPIRWICDDAQAFVAREIRRGSQYDGILLDPPRYGRGPNGEVWKFETDIQPLLRDCASLLTPDARFMILTAYTLRLSSVSVAHMLHDVVEKRGGALDYGELLLGDAGGARPLSTSLFARWAAT